MFVNYAITHTDIKITANFHNNYFDYMNTRMTVVMVARQTRHIQIVTY